MLQKFVKDPGAPVMLANIDLDTGDRVKLGDYPRADQTYARLLERLTSKPDRIIPVDVKKNIFEYYASSGTTPDSQAEITERLMTLRTMRVGDPQ